MRAYYGSRISENMTRTPEGFLICHNVPVARTGWQEYLAEEIGQKGGGTVQVFRPPEEVFAPGTLASFEGKPVTNDHPPEEVVPYNAATYGKGHAQNVRRGTGEEKDYLLADLFITDGHLIRLIESGKREVSCGYECQYGKDEQSRVIQTAIRGNHIAVVDAGRAGETVAIKDGALEKTKETRRKPKMAKNGKQNALKRLLAFVRDEDITMPSDKAEELAEIMDEYAEEKAADNEETKDNQTETESTGTAADNEEPVADNGALQQILDHLQALDEKLESLSASQDEDPLTELEKELSGEKAILISPDSEPEDIADEDLAASTEDDETTEDNETAEDEDELQQDEEGPVMPPSDRPDNPIPNADAIKYVRQLKKQIAKVKDKSLRKQMADSAANLARAAYGAKPRRSQTNAYGQLMNQSRMRTSDSRKTNDISTMGKTIMQSRNPHYQKKG